MSEDNKPTSGEILHNISAIEAKAIFKAEGLPGCLAQLKTIIADNDNNDNADSAYLAVASIGFKYPEVRGKAFEILETCKSHNILTWIATWVKNAPEVAIDLSAMYIKIQNISSIHAIREIVRHTDNISIGLDSLSQIAKETQDPRVRNEALSKLVQLGADSEDSALKSIGIIASFVDIEAEDFWHSPKYYVEHLLTPYPSLAPQAAELLSCSDKKEAVQILAHLAYHKPENTETMLSHALKLKSHFNDSAEGFGRAISPVLVRALDPETRSTLILSSGDARERFKDVLMQSAEWVPGIAPETLNEAFDDAVKIINIDYQRSLTLERSQARYKEIKAAAKPTLEAI